MSALRARWLFLLILCGMGYPGESRHVSAGSMSRPSIVYISSDTVIATWLTMRDPKYFVVEYKKQPDNWNTAQKIHIKGKKRQVSIEHLLPSSLYQMRIKEVYSTNADMSPVRAFRTKRAALESSTGIPQGFALGPLSQNRLRLKWDITRGFSAKDVVQFSVVYAQLYSPYLKKTYLLLPGNYRSFLLTNLRPDTFYKAKIAAFLKMGRGPYTPWTLAKTLSPTSDCVYNCTQQRPTTDPVGAIEAKAATPSLPNTSTQKLSTPKALTTQSAFPTKKKGCERLTPSLCSDIGYSHTLVTSHESQKHVIDHVNIMWPELKNTCTSHFLVKQFMCAALFPYCDVSLDRSFPPCRSMCEAALSRCAAQTARGNTEHDSTAHDSTARDSWPADLKCDQFPKMSETLMCLSYGVEEKAITTATPLKLMPTSVNLTETEEDKTGITDAPPTVTSPGRAKKVALKSTVEPVAVSHAVTGVYRATINGEMAITDTVPTLPSTGRAHKLEKSTISFVTSERKIVATTPTNKITQPNDFIPTRKQANLETTTSAPVIYQVPQSPHCEPLTIGMCEDIGYTHTGFPNYFGHQQQYDAHMELYQYWPIVELGCSPLLKKFLCGLYAPVCTDATVKGRGWAKMPRELLPCKSVCRQVKKGCDLQMGLLGRTWSPNMECDNFPDDAKGEKCLHGNDDVTVHVEQNKCFTLPPRHPCSRNYQNATLSAHLIHVTQLDQLESSNIISRTLEIVRRVADKKCARNLGLYLCSLYLPRCTVGADTGTPCRSLCRTTARRCTATLENLGFNILGLDNCKKFPRYRCLGKKPKTS